MNDIMELKQNYIIFLCHNILKRFCFRQFSLKLDKKGD